MGIIKSMLDEEMPPANCDECIESHCVEAIKNGKYQCKECKHITEVLHQCEHCGEYSTSFHEVSGLDGCEQCDGKDLSKD